MGYYSWSEKLWKIPWRYCVFSSHLTGSQWGLLGRLVWGYQLVRHPRQTRHDHAKGYSGMNFFFTMEKIHGRFARLSYLIDWFALYLPVIFFSAVCDWLVTDGLGLVVVLHTWLTWSLYFFIVLAIWSIDLTVDCAFSFLARSSHPWGTCLSAGTPSGR